MLTIRELQAQSPGPVFLLDLHSTSGAGAPFCIAPDTLFSLQLQDFLPVPMVLDLEQRIPGTLLSCFAKHGHAAVVVEGGQHAAPETIRNLEAAVWLQLVAGGGLELAAAPFMDAHYARLKEATRGLPGVIEILYRHSLSADEAFEMLPGFRNFQPVGRGDLLAHSAAGPVTACVGGRILMPLYQGQGSDGFFLGREVGRTWLAMSTRARRAGLHRLASSLPGVVPESADLVRLKVQPELRPGVDSMLRLLGFRREPASGSGSVEYVRRPEPALGSRSEKLDAPAGQ